MEGGAEHVGEFGRFRDSAPSAETHPEAACSKHSQTIL